MEKIKILSEYGYNRVLTNQDNLPVAEVDENDLALIGKTKKFVYPVPAGDNAQYVTDMTEQEIANAQTQAQAWQAEADKQGQIAALKAQLAAMDYKTSKYADGEYTEEQWQMIVTERQSIRMQLRALEGVDK